jgi:hypothetical protein
METTAPFRYETLPGPGSDQAEPHGPDWPTALPADETPGAAPYDAADATTLGLVELLLKDPGRVDRLNREPDRQRELFPRFLLVAEASYLLFGVVILLIINLAPAAAYPHSLWLRMPPAHWGDGTALSLPLAYTLGLVLAACVCLPAFYFYSLLAGVKMTWLQITSVIGKGMAANAIMLLGILPVYVAAVLGEIVFAAPTEVLQWTLKLGLLLPFVAGLWGLRAIYLGVMDLAASLPPRWQCRRHCFLRRLVLSWAAVYTAVVPIMIYRLWEYFAVYLHGLA